MSETQDAPSSPASVCASTEPSSSAQSPVSDGAQTDPTTPNSQTTKSTELSRLDRACQSGENSSNPNPLLPSASPVQKVLIVDTQTKNLRRVDDLATGVLNLVLMVLVVLGAIYGHTTAQAVTDDITNVFLNTTLAQLLLLPLSVLQNTFTFIAPLALLVLLALRKRWWSLVHCAFVGLVGGCLALAVSKLLELLPTLFRASLTVWGIQGQIVAISTPIVALSAMITLAGDRKHEKIIRWLWTFAWIVLALAVLQGRMTLPSAVLTVLLGVCLGDFARYLFGVRNYRPSGSQIALALHRVGIVPQRIIRLDRPGHNDLLTAQEISYDPTQPERLESTHTRELDQLDPVEIQLAYCSYDLENETLDWNNTSRYYMVWDQDDRRYLIRTSDADIRKTAWLNDLWNNIRLRTLQKSTKSTVRQGGEYEALMSAMTSKFNLNSRTYYGVTEAGSSMLNIFYYDQLLRPLIKVDPLDLKPQMLEAAWALLLQAHQHGLAHRNITPNNLCLSPAGEIYLVNWEQGEVATSELAKRVDKIQLLVLSAIIFGPELALQAAQRALGKVQLHALAPLLQSLAVPTETRAKAKADKILPRLRQSLLPSPEETSPAHTDNPASSPSPSTSTASTPAPVSTDNELRRFSPKAITITIIGLLAAIVVLGSLNFKELYQTVAAANAWWIMGGIVFSLAMSYGQALSLQAVTPNRLKPFECYLAQLAGSVTALVAPTGVGVAALNLRYLMRHRMTATLALATVSLMQGFQFIVTVSLLMVMLAFTGNSMNVQFPSGTLLVAVTIVTITLTVVLAIPKVRNWIWAKIKPTFAQIWPRLVWIMTSPKRIFLTVFGVIMQTMTQVICFYCALGAFGYHLPLSTLTVTFLVSNTLGSVIPTPGGLGPVEAALTGGLQVAGIPATVALPTALLYRLLTFWLRAPIGWVALKVLQKRNIL